LTLAARDDPPGLASGVPIASPVDVHMRAVAVQIPFAFSGRTVISVAALVALSVAAVAHAGLHYVAPIGLFALLAIVLPFAAAVAWLIGIVERAAIPARYQGLAGAVLGVLILAVYWPDRLWFLIPVSGLALVGLGRMVTRPRDGATRAVAGSLILIAALYAIIWNANYLALLASRFRLQDEAARAIDLWIYQRTDDHGLFPIVHMRLLVMACERGYVSLFLGIFLTPILLVREPAALRRFITQTATCYAVGLVVFLMWPVVGPCLMYPDSIDAMWSGENTRQIMAASLMEFDAIRAGGQPVSGFGYFVGVPSLHVAMAILMQWTIGRRSRVAGWMVAPMNVFAALATFVLGYHYLIDVAGGITLAAMSIALWHPHGAVARLRLHVSRRPCPA
jgi:hypothetical protein